MRIFAVDNAASEEIGRIFRGSNCRDPVAELVEIGDPTDREGKLRTIRILARERSDLRPGDLCDVGGVAFVRAAVEALPDFCLTFDGERILLRGSKGELHTSLRSAVAARRGPLPRPIASAAEAIEAAKRAWAEVSVKTRASDFSKENWAKFEPYSATLENGIWNLTGTVSANYLGNRYLITVRASDGTVDVRLDG